MRWGTMQSNVEFLNGFNRLFLTYIDAEADLEGMNHRRMPILRGAG